MKHTFPQNNTYLQNNRSTILGNLWSSFNLDFQSNLGIMRLAKKLVNIRTSDDSSNLGLPGAFEFFYDLWWAICGTKIFKNTSGELTSDFAEETTGFYTTAVTGDSTTQFDVTNTVGTTFRYTYDTNGTNPLIDSSTFPVGSIVVISDNTNFAAVNRGTFVITGSGSNYFEVTNAFGFAQNNKTLGSGTLTIEAVLATPTFSSFLSDLKAFNDRLWVTATDALYSKSIADGSLSDIWIRRDTLTSSTPHNMAYFKKFNSLYYKDTNTSIKSIDSSDVVSSSGNFFIDLGSVGFITSLVAGSNIIWVGTQRINITSSVKDSGLNGSILQWDGFSSQISNEFLLPSSGCLALTILDDIPYAIDSDGRLLKFTGYSFKEVARLPIGNKKLTLATGSASTNGRFIHFNGIQATENNTILVLINNLNQDALGSVNENLPSGVWECDLATGNFTHKHSLTLKSRASSTVSDYGQNRILSAGALKVNTLMSNSVNGRSSLVCGANFYTDGSTSKSGIFIDSPSDATTDNEGQKRGYFVTTWIDSAEVTENFTRLWAKYRKLLNTDDKLIFKYRLDEETPVEADITWLTTVKFTTSVDVSAYNGYEAEILQGTGSGSCNNITDVSVNAGIYTVTLEDEVPNISGTAKARFQKWIKLGEISGQVNSYGEIAIAKADTRIQIKGVLEFTGDDEFHRMTVSSTEQINSNP